MEYPTLQNQTNLSLINLMKSNPDDISPDMLINIWLEEFFSTNIDKLRAKNKYAGVKVLNIFYDHSVTKEQHYWWYFNCRYIFKVKFGKELGARKFIGEALKYSPLISLKNKK